MIFLKSYEELSKEYTLQPCYINNVFHSTPSGRGACFFAENNNGSFFHVYKNIDLTYTRSGQTIFEIIDFGTKYFYNRYFNQNEVLFFTKLNMHDIKLITDICQTSKSFKNFFKAQNEFYIEQIQPQIKPYELHPQLLYDVAIENTHVIFLRPVKLIDDPHFFRLGQRNVFFTLLKLFAKSEECRSRYQLKENKIRERLICSPSSFINRLAPPELKCEYGSAEQCMHIVANEIDGKIELRKPEYLCKFLLKRMLDDHEEGIVANELEFSCHFRHFDERTVPLLFAFNLLYKRTIYIHRMCLPNYLIKTEWYNWFKKMVQIE